MKYIILLFLLLGGCKSNQLPKERLSQFRLNVNYEFQGNELRIAFNNPLHCPVRISIKTQDSGLKSRLEKFNPITLNPLKDSLFTISIDETDKKKLTFSARLGDMSKPIRLDKVDLPFQQNKSYKLIQGYDSEPTHNTDMSRYALDFGLSIGDTICAAMKGYVVGVVKDYKSGGEGKEWKDYGNFITIYDPESGVFTQYVHLKYKGSFVNIGDSINSGQIIGLSGMTGQTNIEHLHFNCLKPADSEDGLISIPIDSIGLYKISELKRNQLIINDN
ncbi:MAG: M23 family metallopeptidase [Bacteroidia bacterium]|nr:M23 family metallopeptidase [Bacteroidia bacterium]